mmetsp:Transcript_4427/g.6600  ORF Transcript_4427/g.6600 Transcript_4427/m.6600 type:complete len:484 (+) Transcript_4427:34-1485(+)
MSENLVSDAHTLAGLDRSKPFWWRRLTDCDPISLEPLRRLRVEPFELTADGTRAYFFDARLLSSYLISSGSFTHPISRRDLTREDCRRLDAHLRKHRLGKACVEHAFDHQEDYKKQNAPNNQVRDIQAEASELLRAFYAAGERGGLGGRGRGRSGESIGRQDYIEEYVDEENFMETVPLGGAQLSSAADFPSLAGDAPPVAAPLQASWVTGAALGASSRNSSGVNLTSDEAFPTLGGSGCARAGERATPLRGWGGHSASAVMRAPIDAQVATVPPAGVQGAALRTSAPPSMESTEAFPSLTGGVPLRSTVKAAPSTSAAGAAPNGGGWSRALLSAPPATTMASAVAPTTVAPPPIESAEAFPTLGGAARRVPASSAKSEIGREELVRRNRELLSALAGELDDGKRERGMNLFKIASLAFQRGSSDAAAYLSAFINIFGAETANIHFSEIIALCPEKSRRDALQRCYNSFRTSQSHGTGARSQH